MKKIKSIFKKICIKSDREKYIEYYRQLPVDNKAIWLEARNGKEIDGNIFYIASEILSNPNYCDFRLFISAENEDLKSVFARKLKTEGLKRVSFLTVGSDEYYRIAATAGYIVSDATLKNFFIKKEGQVYLNVWHGTPFKVMGKRVTHEPHAIGNVQKNFIIADYLLYPSRYMMDHMVEDYMISGLSDATVLLGGYPRNIAFFDTKRREEIIEECNLNELRVYVYMPTFRPQLMGDTLAEVLKEIDVELSDNEVLFAKVHPLAADEIDFSCYENIRPFPEEYETYEFLNVADCLITDYSSVFYDFVSSGRKIVLFTYDEDDYLSSRGLYAPMASLPFIQTKTVSATLDAARLPKDYDDSRFSQEYGPFESPDAAAELVKRLIYGDSYCRELKIPSAKKPNTLVYAGTLNTASRINSAMDFLAKADYDEKNYYLVFNRTDVKDNYEFLLNLPEGSMYFGRAGKMIRTGNEDEDMRLEWLRCFGEMPVDDIIFLTDNISDPLAKLLNWKGL